MKTNIDEDLYSRQLLTYGNETMGKLVKMRVFLHGLKGLGAEVAKNLILAGKKDIIGPKSVCLHDNELVKINDLGSNFCLKNSHVDHSTRAEASFPYLQKLNDNVQVSV